MGNANGQFGGITKGAPRGFALLGSDLEVAFGTQIRMTAFGHVELAVVQKANGTFAIGRRVTGFRPFQSSGQFAVANQATNRLVFPLTAGIEAMGGSRVGGSYCVVSLLL